MTFFDAETWKVKAVALFGFATPSVNLFLENIQPILKFLILLGQVGITYFTVLYLYQKWKKIRGSKNRKK